MKVVYFLGENMSDILQSILISEIQKNPYQPRLHFNQDELQELAESIKNNGIIQPIIVRKSGIIGYELIAGERRLRASKLAGLTEIPAIIKSISDTDSMKQAIIENLQRSNLNPIEEAKAYQQLIDKNHVTHEELAYYMGKSRPYISNTLRLLKLPKLLQQALEEGKIYQGHARALLGISDEKVQLYWSDKIQKEQLSVRQVELALQEKSTTPENKPRDIFIAEEEKKISQLLGLPVTIKYNKSHNGQISISFSSEEDFHRIINSFK